MGDFIPDAPSGPDAVQPPMQADRLRRQAGEHPVNAALEGLARVATFGESDEFRKGQIEAGGGSPESLGLRKEENPIASTAGEVTGLLTPGPGLFGKAGRGLGALAGGSRLAVGLGEGGLYGLGAAITDDHIGDPKLDADHIAAGVLGGALAGAGAHVVLGKLGDVGRSALMKAFGGKALQSTFDRLGEKALIAHLDMEGNPGKFGLEGRQQEVARYGLDKDIARGAPSFGKVQERAAGHAAEAFTRVQGGLDVADSYGQFDPKAAAARVQPIVDAMQGNPAMTGAREEIQKFVDRLADTGTPATPPGPVVMNGKPLLTYDKALKKMVPVMNPGTPGVPGEAPTTFNKAWETVKDLTKKNPDLFRLRGELQQEIFDQAEKVKPGLGVELQTANRENANALELRRLAGDRASAKKQLSPGDLLLGGAGAHFAGPAGLLTPFAKRAVVERGGFVAASALDKLNQSGALPKILNGFQMLMKSRLSNPGFGGVFRAVLETAAAKSAAELFQTHVSLAQSDPSYLPTVGLENENPATIADYADKAHRLSAITDATAAGGAEIEKSIGRLLGEQGGRAPGSVQRSATREEYDKLMSQLKLLVNDDGAKRRSLAELAPTTAGLAQTQIVAAAQHLLATAPKNPTAEMPPALQRPWAPSKSQLQMWFRRVDAVAHPQHVFDLMRTGTVTPEAISTLTQAYPRLAQDFKDRLQARLAAWDRPLDRKRRQQVSQLLGETTDPQVISLIQASHARMIPPMTGKPDGRQAVDASKNEATQAQRLEGKAET